MRKSIYIDGFSHGTNPVPAGCVVGNQLVTGAIFGTVRETGKLPDTEEAQCRLMFENAGRILEAAGTGWDRVAKMTFFLHPEASRPLINAHWVKLFPDEASRPARHVIVSNTLPATMRVQCDLMAVIA